MKQLLRKTSGIVALIAIMALGGCSSAGSMVVTTPVERSLARYPSLLVTIKADIEDAEQETADLQSRLMDLLIEESIFKRVAVAREEGITYDLLLKVRIVELRRVNQSERFIAGALAGRAKLIAELDLQDARTGKMLGQAQVEGKSGGGTVFAGGTDQAVQKAAEQIVEFLHSQYE